MKPLWLSLLVLAGATLGMRSEDFRTDINPALLYYRAFLVQADPLSDADREYLASKKGREQKLPERFGKVLASYDNQFRLVRQAAHAKVPCDWGIDVSPGPNILLPHLARAKAVAQMAQWRAVWALQHDHQTEARDDLLAAFVLGRHLGSDAFLINAFVQFTIEGLTCGTVAQHFSEFSPETLKQLADGFDAAPNRLTIAACMPSEKDLGEWFMRKIQELKKAHPNDDAKVMADFRATGFAEAMGSVGETNFWPRLIAASGGTSDGVVKLLHEAESMLPRFFALMELPPAEYAAQASQLSAEVQKSPNPFVAAYKFILGWQNRQFRPTEFRCQAQQAMVRAAVEYRLRGESGLKSVRDPFGNGPFSYRRFVFKGVDRGLEIKSAYAGVDAPFVMIFVEKEGPAFQVIGPDAGKAIPK